MTTISLHYDSLTESARHAALDAMKRVGQILPGRWMTLEIWYERARQRRRLRELDDRLLQDIGMSRADAWREGRKRFWKA